MVLGTVGYMSPEQVRGQVADARSDLFALGVVLYEMLSGRRAFHADSPAETMSAILREDPPELASLVTDVSPSIERIVRRCLEKQPVSRFRSAADLAFALEAISTPGSSGAHASPASVVPASSGRVSYRRLTCTQALQAYGPAIVPDGSSGAVIVWSQGRVVGSYVYCNHYAF